ncbi:MAG: rhodanese-like domain-containing protein [Phycisphaerales bacterium]|jgi:rhodanese-related sulfurtransferase
MKMLRFARSCHGLPAAALVLAGVLGAASGCNRGITDADIENITLTELRLLRLEQLDNPNQPVLLLIDPRRREAYLDARLPGALHVTLPDLALQAEVDPSVNAYRNIVVYAEGPGAVSGRAMTKRLLVLGYGQTRLFGGGLIEWADAGFAIESGEPEFEPEPPPTRDVRRPVP